MDWGFNVHANHPQLPSLRSEDHIIVPSFTDVSNVLAFSHIDWSQHVGWSGLVRLPNLFSWLLYNSEIIFLLAGLLIWVLLHLASQHCHQHLQLISGPWWHTTTPNCVMSCLDWNLPDCGRSRELLSTSCTLEIWLALISAETGGFTAFFLPLYDHSQNPWWVYQNFSILFCKTYTALFKVRAKLLDLWLGAILVHLA